MIEVRPRASAYAAYCTAHLGKSLLWTASDLLTIYMLVTLYAMTPVVAGTVFLLGLAANAIADLGVGVWLDRHPHRESMLAGGALLVSATSFPATILLAAYGTEAALTAMLVFRVAYAAYDVPHNALMARLTPDPGHAAWLSRGRTIGTGAAALAVAYAMRASLDPRSVGTMLWLIAGAALVIGAPLIPLLRSYPIGGIVWKEGARLSLPLPFLTGSVVALGALAKAMLHLRFIPVPMAGGDMLLMLAFGRTASAFMPLRITDARRGLTLLAATYMFAAAVAVGFVWSAGRLVVLILGLAMGITNLIGWALLPALARGARGYGLYTMVGKLGLGAAGVMLAAGLGHAPMFATGAFAPFAILVAIACVGAAIIVAPGLTSRGRHGFSPL